ncbi:shikimate kinase [Murimonas intestini]|uniref:Shikimate kinase n=1 Tax=Murimonas intestini TaxID=1337051 RepID=A0AB73SZX2_9FIRM|nr:shikimate kinase [Murimonas intestini]MCR1843209.1 hypothetical protein [Murimonas intestini]MCR1868562.1 hypothetical protein [Murimonas intestini]MCR1885131.1 hypothetical protein [Murimonas intestini]
MKEIYYMGGSPCSGKSTAAKILAERYGLYYFKVDDYLEKYTNDGAAAGMEICSRQSKMSPEEIWMREPSLQCREELQFYGEIFDFIMQDLEAVSKGRDIITEGAAYLPCLMKKRDISGNRYLAVVPAKDFQISHYAQREWVPYVLEGCSDVQKAFDNWMERDCLFAEEVKRQCIQNGYLSFVNDGQTEIEGVVQMVSCHFGLMK